MNVLYKFRCHPLSQEEYVAAAAAVLEAAEDASAAATNEPVGDAAGPKDVTVTPHGRSRSRPINFGMVRCCVKR